VTAPVAKSESDGQHYAEIRIRHFRRAGVSADDRRIAVLNTAFEPFSDGFAAPDGI
jgi:hypothetical protein